MDCLDVLVEAGQSSKVTANAYFILSVCFITYDFYEPGYLPQNLISGMHLMLIFNTLGTAWFLYKYRKIPYATNQRCPSCRSKMAYSELKCLDEYNKDCSVTVKVK